MSDLTPDLTLARPTPERARSTLRVAALSGWALLAPLAGGTALLATAGAVSGWLREMGIAGVLVFVSAAALLAGPALAPTYALTLLSGFAFGWPVGFASAWLGLSVAAVMGWGLSRRLGSDAVEALLDRKPQWQSVRDALLDASLARATMIIFLLRLAPVIPFAMVNLSAGLLRVPLRAMVVGSVLGLIPRIAAISYAGSTLSQLDFSRPGGAGSAIMSIGASLLVIVLLGQLARRSLQRLTRPPVDREHPETDS